MPYEDEPCTLQNRVHFLAALGVLARLVCAAVNTVTLRKTGIPVARSVWSASSLLALSLSGGVLKAGASSAHSKRFAPGNVRTAPEYVTGNTTQSA